MRVDKYTMAQSWMRQDDATPEEAKATWDTLETEFEDKRKAQLMASAETDAIIKTINDKFGPGTMFPASEAPIPPMTDQQAIFEFGQRNPAAEGGRMLNAVQMGEAMGNRTGFAGNKKNRQEYYRLYEKNRRVRDYKYSGVFKIKTGEDKGKYTFQIRNPDYTGKGSNEPPKIKMGPFDNETDAIEAFKERQKIMGEIKLSGPQAKVTEHTKAINNFVTDFYEKNLNEFKLKDYQSFEKKLIEEFKNSEIKDLGSGKNQRKALNFGFPNIGKKAKKKASKTPLTLYGMDARTPSGLNLQTDAQSFFKKAFYSGKLKNNPELVGKLRRYLEYYNTDKKFYKGKYIDRAALKANYADVLDPKVKSDLIYLLESDQLGTGKLRSSIIKQYLPDEYDTYVKKKNASGIRYQELMKKIENSLTKKQLTTALNGETSIKTFMRNQTDLLNKIFDTSELKNAGYSELIFNADHLEGMAEIAQMKNADDQIRALKNLVGTTSEINRELGLDGFSSKRRSLMQKITNGTNVEANIDELNKITKAAYPQFEGDLYKYNPATKTAIPTKNFIFNYDPETAFRQYFNELVKHPVGSEILTKQYVDNPELQKVIKKDPKLNELMEDILGPEWCGQADGGRIGFSKGSGCPIDVKMKNFQEANDRVRLGEGTMDDAAKIRKTNIKGVKSAGSLKALLGIWGLGGEALIEGAFAANEMMKGKSGREAWSESYASYLDPTMYKGGIKLSGQDVAMRELDLNTGEQLALKLDNQSKQLMKLIEQKDFSEAEGYTGEEYKQGDSAVTANYDKRIAALKQEMESTKAQLAEHGGMEANTQSIQVKLDDYRDKQGTTAFTKPYQTNLVTYRAGTPDKVVGVDKFDNEIIKKGTDPKRIQRSRAGKNNFVNREIVGRELFDQDAIPQTLVPNETIDTFNKIRGAQHHPDWSKEDLLRLWRTKPSTNKAFWKLQMGQDSPVKGNIYGASDTFFGETYSNGGIAGVKKVDPDELKEAQEKMKKLMKQYKNKNLDWDAVKRSYKIWTK